MDKEEEEKEKNV